VLERAAVIGRGFWPSAVSELLPAEARPAAAEHLRALVRRGLLHPHRSTLGGEDELRFHHILIRDVAYRSTPKSLRARLHEQFADWLAARIEGWEEFVGYHLDQSVAYRRELGPSDAELVALAARGGEQLTAAGRRALARGDANAGARSLRRSTALFEIAGAQRPDVLLDLGVALGEIGELPEAERALETAREQAERTNLEGLGARISIELSDQRALVDSDTRVDEMLAVAEQAKAVFTRLGDDAGVSRAWQHIAEVHWIRCRCAEMEEVLERALEHADRAGEALDQSRILSALAAATVFGPRPVSDGIRRCMAILERAHDDVRLGAVTETMLAVLEAMRGDFDQARERCGVARRRLQEVGLGVTVAGLQMYVALIELMAGSPENAEPDVRAGYEVLEQTGNRSNMPTTAALLARLLYAQGHHEEADHYCTISQQSASAEDVGSQVLWRGTRGKILVQSGDARAAVELADSAVAIAEGTDLLMIHGDALADRAEVLSRLGRPDDAVRDLDEAEALYERKGMQVSVQAARRSRNVTARSGGQLG
jgi:tetratricopeptide (TPR) repeat protein